MNGQRSTAPATVSTAPAAPRHSAGTPSTMLMLLTMSYAVAYVDRLMMSVVAEPVKREFGFNDTQLFFLTGAAFVLVYGAGGIFSGWLLDRFSRRRTIAVMLAAWSGFTALCGLATGFGTLAAARAGVGLGESAIVPAGMATISDSYPPERRPLAMGIFYAGGMIGVLAAWTLGGWVAETAGWRYAFLLAGPPGLVLAALIYYAGWDPPRHAVGPAAPAGGLGASIMLVWRNRPLLWTIAAGSISTFVNVGLVTQLGSFFIRSHGLSLGQVGLIFGPILAAGMALGLVGGGWIGNRLARRGVGTLIVFSGVAMVALFPIYIAMFAASDLSVALAAMFVGTTVSTIYSPGFSAAYQALSEPRTRATAAGVSSCLNSMVGGALTPLLVGVLSDAWAPSLGGDSLRYAMMAGTASCLLSALMFAQAYRLTRAAGIR